MLLHEGFSFLLNFFYIIMTHYLEFSFTKAACHLLLCGKKLVYEKDIFRKCRILISV